MVIIHQITFINKKINEIDVIENVSETNTNLNGIKVPSGTVVVTLIQ